MLHKVIAVWVSLFIAGCSLVSREAPSEDVEKAGALFFERLKAADYDAIYSDASAMFKENQPRATILDNLKQINALGRIQDYRRLSMRFEGDPKNRLASPVYAVTFEQVRAEITLNFKDDGGEWKLLGFSVKQKAT
jgi:hypothetical protein